MNSYYCVQLSSASGSEGIGRWNDCGRLWEGGRVCYRGVGVRDIVGER